MYDAIVVGARCAGAPTAMLLARKGYRVLLVDRASFPSDIMSGHYIHQPGVAQLRRWGLLERVRTTGCPPITGYTFDVGPFALTGAAPPADGVHEGYGPRRLLLDKILVDAAVEAGVELRERFSVQELVWNTCTSRDGDRVVGIRGRGGSGATVEERAHIVIGADGPRSLIARAVQAPSYHARASLTCAYYSYWSGIAIDGVELYPRNRRFIVAMPTNDGLTYVGVSWPVEEFHACRADVASSHQRALEDDAPELAERVRAGRREERFVGTADNSFFFRQSHGPGWALVGDAGYHKDPITAQGMTDAFRDAEALAEAIDAGLSELRPLADALADYQTHRDGVVMPMYEMTYQLAALQPPPPEMQELMRALRGNQSDTDRFLGTVAGTTPIAEFYAPENLERIVGAGLAVRA
jgi:flavin-dependent dehydrogenase